MVTLVIYGGPPLLTQVPTPVSFIEGFFLSPQCLFFLFLERKSMSIIAVPSMSGFRVDSFWKLLGGFVSVVQKMVEAVLLGGTSNAAGGISLLLVCFPRLVVHAP